MAMVTIRMDDTLKKDMEATCKELGMSMTTAFTVFAKQVTRQHRIPFEITTDPFYSESNVRHIQEAIKELDEGKYVVKTMEELEAMANE